METIKLELTIAELNGILGVLGELPTKSGVYPLILKIKEQADPQVPTQEAE